MQRVLKTRLHHRVIVTLKDGASFGGVLWETDREGVILRDAQAIVTPQTQPVGVDGELYLPWSNISFIQKP